MSRDEGFYNLFPEITYDKDQVGQLSLDIWNNYRTVILPKNTTNDPYIFHNVVETDTIEGLSRIYYNTDRLWWLILLINDADDPFEFLTNALYKRNNSNRAIKILKLSYVNPILTRIQQIRELLSKRDVLSKNNNEVIRENS
jgi:hypothetical protein